MPAFQKTSFDAVRGVRRGATQQKRERLGTLAYCRFQHSFTSPTSTYVLATSKRTAFAFILLHTRARNNRRVHRPPKTTKQTTKMSGSIVSRNREATVQHYATIAQEQRQHTASAAFLASQDNSSSSRNSKLSAGMRKSLQDLQRSLNCALCGNVTVRPVTLTCAHTFCCACIDVYSENNWVCPSTYAHALESMALLDRNRKIVFIFS